MQVENDILVLGKVTICTSITFPSFCSIYIFSVAKDREVVTVDQAKKNMEELQIQVPAEGKKQ